MGGLIHHWLLWLLGYPVHYWLLMMISYEFPIVFFLACFLIVSWSDLATLVIQIHLG